MYVLQHINKGYRPWLDISVKENLSGVSCAIISRKLKTII